MKEEKELFLKNRCGLYPVEDADSSGLGMIVEEVGAPLLEMADRQAAAGIPIRGILAWRLRWFENFFCDTFSQ